MVSTYFYEAIFAGAATTCAGHGDKELGFGGMRVEASGFGLCLHAIISDFTGRELSHRRFSCGDPLSAGHFDSGWIVIFVNMRGRLSVGG